MKQSFFVIMFFAFTKIFAQNELSYVFTSNGLINFNTNPVSLHNVNQVQANFGSAISDSKGKLVFYTDGPSVFDADNNQILNGKDIVPYNTLLRSIIIPCPERNGVYYIFTIRRPQLITSKGLFTTIVDTNGGLHVKEDHKGMLLNSEAAGAITAVLHQNKRDVWIITHEIGSKRLLAYLLTESGIISPPVESYSSVDISDLDVQLTPSLDGTMIALATYWTNFQFSLFSFNPTNGQLSEKLKGTFPGKKTQRMNAVFSPSSKSLFIITPDIYKIDLSNNLQIPVTPIISIQQSTFARISKLLPNNTIYVAELNGNGKWFILKDPDSAHPELVGSDIGGNLLFGEYPYYLLSPAIPAILQDGQCLSSSIQFALKDLGAGSWTVSWDFGDGRSGTGLQTQHVFTTSGSYTITAAISGSKSYILTKKLDVSARPTPPNIKISGGK